MIEEDKSLNLRSNYLGSHLNKKNKFPERGCLKTNQIQVNI